LSEKLVKPLGFDEIVGSAPEFRSALAIAAKAARARVPVLIEGANGSGKEMIAQAIHTASPRGKHEMITLHCGATPATHVESALFGHEKGSFTGAFDRHIGRFEEADGTTLFLEEVGALPLEVQVKLLRALDTGEFQRIGGRMVLTADVRVIASTSRPLGEEIARGAFREDLFYRLNVVHLKLPPLRERREETPPLVEHYLRKCSDEQKKGRLTLDDETFEYLLLYSWPGNLRQLANEVRRMVAMAEADSVLTPMLLSPEIQASRRTIPATVSLEPEVRVRIDQPLPAAVELLEQTMVKSALDKTHGRVEEAARILGISRKGLFLKRRRWGLSLQQQ